MPSTPPRAAWGRDYSGQQYQRAVHLSPAAAGNPESFLLLSEVLLCCVSEQFLVWLFCFSINFSLPLKTLCYVLCLWMLCLYVHLCPTIAPGAGRSQEKHLILWNLSHRWLWAAMWVRELWAPVSAVNHGASSPNTRTAFGDCFIGFFPLWEAWECPALTWSHTQWKKSALLWLLQHFPLTAHSAGSL